MGNPAPDVDDRSTAAAGGDSRYRLLYPILDSKSNTIVHLAADLATATGAELFVGLLETCGETSPYDTSREAATIAFQTDADGSIGIDVTARSLTGTSPLEAIVTEATTMDVDAIILNDISERLEAQLSRRLGCDTITVNEQAPLESVASILVPIAGGPHSGPAVAVASALAGANDAWLELVHILEESDPAATRERAATVLTEGSARVPDSVEVDTRVIEGRDVAEEIVGESNYHDVTIIGAPRKGRLRRMIFGSTAGAVRDRAPNTVLMVRGGSDPTQSLFSSG